MSMRTHVEYDDFGEYIETYDDFQPYSVCGSSQEITDMENVNILRKMLRGVFMTLAAFMVIFTTTSYASDASGKTGTSNTCQSDRETAASVLGGETQAE